MHDDASILLLCAAKESGNVHKSHQWYIECIAETYKTGSLARSVDVKDSGKNLRLVGHDAHRPSVHMCKSDDDVLCPALVYFKKTPVIDYASYDLIHVVGLVRIVRNDVVQGIVHSSHRI